MTDTEKREASRQFYQKWVGKGKEDEDDRSYWLDLVGRVLGVENATDHIDFQKKVVVEGHTKRIDVYIPETKVIIEQKTLGIALDKKAHQSGGIELTPYEQAKRYNDNLPYDEKARWIVTSNFGEIWIYDMNTRVPEPVKLTLADLQSKYSMLDFLINQKQTKLSEEMEVSVKAGELVGIIYDALYKQYIDPESERALKSLNMLCVRLVFCLYAEDACIFSDNNRHMFRDYLQKFDAPDIRKALMELFKILDTKPEDRDPYDTSDLSKFPYVNGGLFADENIEIPHFTEEIKNILLANASDDFDWSAISPTIFGAVFESTLNPETRRSGGMHYTSIENIHKVIEPLFLNDLRNELAEIKEIKVEKNKNTKLKAFQSKLANLKWLDPACGSGNFLTETYISIRRLENQVISSLKALEKGQMEGQIVLGEAINPIEVSINQFYGIEINDFAVTVAKTALWIAESQMMKETEDIVLMSLDFLPLKTNANIIEGNALRLDWNNIISKNELNYIMGNPPFSAGRRMGDTQREDMNLVASDFPKNGDLDYVSAWYIKASQYMNMTSIKAGFVSTSSITQGEQVILLWKKLFEENKLNIFYAIRSFNWTSEAKSKAGVHCVIIEFVIGNYVGKKFIEEGSSKKEVSYINGYLMDTPDVWIDGAKRPICKVPLISNGSKPLDNAICAFTPEEKEEFIKLEPNAEPYFYKYMGSREFINNIERWFLIINRIPPEELLKMPLVLERLERIKEYRLSSNSIQTKKLAEFPAKFHFENMPTENYLVIPQTSSGKRRYIPIGFLTPDIMVNNKLQVMKNAGLYEFGILSSNVHNAWLRTVAGRLREDFTYSVSVVYNTFPWPEATDEQKKLIEATAQGILAARAMYPNNSLADMYGEKMYIFENLVKAHNANNKAVMQAYGFSVRNMSEDSCVAELMKMYEKKIRCIKGEK